MDCSSSMITFRSFINTNRNISENAIAKAKEKAFKRDVSNAFENFIDKNTKKQSRQHTIGIYVAGSSSSGGYSQLSAVINSCIFKNKIVIILYNSSNNISFYDNN